MQNNKGQSSSVIKKEKLIKKSCDRYEIFVKEPAQNNATNKRILLLLAYDLGIDKSCLQITKGQKFSSKYVKILN